MKRIVIYKPGSYDRLQVEKYEAADPKPNEIGIEIKYFGVNYADIVVRMGLYESARVYNGWPITPGFEFSGIVRKLGRNSKKYKLGQEVFGVSRFGAYSSYINVEEDFLMPLPEDMSLEKAAGFPVTFLTAYYGLFICGNPKPGMSALVHSGAGGTGSALLQLLKIMDIETAAVIGSGHKRNYLESFYSGTIIDKSSEDLWERLKIFKEGGFDLIFDANGVETLNQSYKSLCSGGRLIVYGFHTMLPKKGGKPNWIKLIYDYFKTPRFNPLDLTTDNKGVIGFNLSFLFHKSGLFKETMNQLLSWYKEGKIKVHEPMLFDFKDLAKAHQKIESGQTTGKLVIKVD